MASSNKAVDIGGFFDSQAPAETESHTKKKRRKKAIGDVVHVTLRLTPAQWEKAHQFARSEGVSLNQLALDGINMLLTDRGLPELPEI